MDLLRYTSNYNLEENGYVFNETYNRYTKKLSPLMKIHVDADTHYITFCSFDELSLKVYKVYLERMAELLTNDENYFKVMYNEITEEVYIITTYAFSKMDRDERDVMFDSGWRCWDMRHTEMTEYMKEQLKLTDRYNVSKS
jgi:hypothetical protein